MAALLGFIKESHKKLKQGLALYQTSLLYKIQNLLNLNQKTHPK